MTLNDYTPDTSLRSSVSYTVRHLSYTCTFAFDMSFYYLLGIRGAVLHHSAETVLYFRIHVLCVSFFSFFFFSKYQQRVKTSCLWCRTGPVCLQQYSCHSVHDRDIDISSSDLVIVQIKTTILQAAAFGKKTEF